MPEEHQASSVTGLGMDPLDGQIRQVFFFDTPDLQLNKSGVVVRARRIQGKGGDSIVKLRPVVPSELPGEVRRSAGFRTEVDVLPDGFVCSGTLKGTPSAPDWQKNATRPLLGISGDSVAFSDTPDAVLIRPSAFGPITRIP